MTRHKTNVDLHMHYGFGSMHFSIKETEERLRPFRGKRATALFVDFEDTSQTYAAEFIDENSLRDEDQFRDTNVDLYFEWNFGDTRFGLKESVEKLKPFMGKRAVSLCVSFEDSDDTYLGFFPKNEEEEG